MSLNTTVFPRSGVVESANDVLVPVGNVHYLPDREVVREDKNTTKVKFLDPPCFSSKF